MFDTDVDSSSPKATVRQSQHRCIDIDFPNGICHRDCARCRAVVFVNQEDEGWDDISIDPNEGARCTECSEVYCSDCVSSDRPTLCVLCAEAVVAA